MDPLVPDLPPLVAHGFIPPLLQVIRLNLSAIIVELLRALGDRKWRDRQSACAGLADVLRGRSWDALGPHLEELWIMADRYENFLTAKHVQSIPSDADVHERMKRTSVLLAGDFSHHEECRA